MTLAEKFSAKLGMAVAIATAMLFAFPAFAQDSRLSLADRVTRLEQQAQSNKDGGGVGLVNQMSALQAQLRQMQGQIEELQHQLQQLDDKSKAQYIDLDSRLSRIEQGNTGGAGTAAPTQNPAGGAAAGAQSGPAPAGSATPASAADNGAAQAAYDVAFKSIRQGDYAAAAREFRAFVQQYPDHPLAPNAWYWLGESYYVTTNYSVALDAFKHVVSQFPNSEKAPDALLKVGFTQLELKQDADGKATLTSVVSKYPGTNAAQLAQERLQRLQRSAGT